MPDSGRSKIWDLTLVFIGGLVFAVIAGVIVHAITTNSTSDNSANGGPAPSTSISSDDSHSSRPAAHHNTTVPARPSPSPSQRAVIVQPPKLPQYLSNAQFADTNTANVGTGSIGIDKQQYVNSIWVCSDLELVANINCDNASSPYWVDYNVPAGYGSFSATIGYSADSPSNCDATFEIFGDGNQLYSRQLYFGDSIPIHLRVGQYLRIRLQVVPYKGLVCNEVFGNAEFTP